MSYTDLCAHRRSLPRLGKLKPQAVRRAGRPKSEARIAAILRVSLTHTQRRSKPKRFSLLFLFSVDTFLSLAADQTQVAPPRVCRESFADWLSVEVFGHYWINTGRTVVIDRQQLADLP